MKAIVQSKYGSPDEVLELTDVEEPKLADNEVLVRVVAAPVAGDDWHLMRGLPYVARLETGLFRPKHHIPGREISGRVVAIGKLVKEFQPGDEVFGWCNGALAEYVAVSEDTVVPKPANVTFEEAAAVPISGLTALQALRDGGRIRSGQRVLINGASGGVGTFTVQLAKWFGAEVTAVCSTRNLELVRSLGAHHVIDYIKRDFTRGGAEYDLIVDIVGNRRLADCRRALTRNGTLVLVGGTGGRWFKGTQRFLQALALTPFVSHTLRPLIHSNDKRDLLELKKLIEGGRIRPVIDARFPLREVKTAIRHLGDGHGRGKVVLAM